MARQTDRTRLTLRWILICLTALGLAWSAPSASAAPAESGLPGQHPGLVHTRVIADFKTAVLTPSAPGVTVHHARSVDAAFDGPASSSGRVHAVAVRPLDASNLTSPRTTSSAPRAPPVAGLT